MSRKVARALMDGLAFGMAVAIVDLAFGTWNFTKSNLPAFTGGVIQSVAIEIVLGGLVGVVAAPLRTLRVASGPAHFVASRLPHLVAMTLLWLAISWWAAVDRAVVPMWASPASLGALLVLAGTFAGWRRPMVPIAAGVAVLVALVFLPAISQVLRDDDLARKERPAARTLAAGEQAPPDVVVVVLDTVRAASMSAYGYGLPTTPVFDELAASSALFLDASAPGTWSLPSHASLFTGLYASVHGAHDEHRFLSDAWPTLASTLSAAGYQTLAFTANPWISDHLGLTRGFDWSDEAWRDGGGGRAFFFSFRLLDKLGFGPTDKGGAEVAGNFEEWLASRPANAGPAFAFLNFLEAHFPHHQLPEEFLARFTRQTAHEQHEYSRRLFATQFGPPMSPVQAAETRRPAREMYDAGVAYTDSLLGRVVEALRRRGSLDRTLLVVLADHGELLGEHGEFGHGLSIFQPTMRVPLLVRLPGVVPPVRVPAAVSTAGVFATVLDVLELAKPEAAVVTSLVPALEGKPAGQPVIAERFAGEGGAGREHPLLRNTVRLRAYRSGAWKLVETSAGESFLFDLESDPDEDRNVASDRPAELARLRNELSVWRAALAMPDLGAIERREVELDPAAKERLKALGYVE